MIRRRCEAAVLALLLAVLTGCAHAISGTATWPGARLERVVLTAADFPPGVQYDRREIGRGQHHPLQLGAGPGRGAGDRVRAAGEHRQEQREHSCFAALPDHTARLPTQTRILSDASGSYNRRLSAARPR